MFKNIFKHVKKGMVMEGTALAVLFYLFLIFSGYYLLVINISGLINNVLLNNPDYRQPSDFQMYYTGAKIAQEGKIHELYNLGLQKQYQAQIAKPAVLGGLLAFRAPPIVALLYSPFASLPYTHAYIVNMLLNTFATSLIVLVILLATRIHKKVFWFLTGLIPLFLPIWATISSGQYTIFIVLLLALFYYAYTKEGYFSAGLLLGMLFLRPQFLVIVPLIILASYRDVSLTKKMCLGIGISIISNIFITILLIGVKNTLNYPAYLLKTETLSNGTDLWLNANISSVIALFVTDHALVNILNIVLNISLYFLLFYFLIRKNSSLKEFPLYFSAFIFLTPTLNIHTMPTDLLIIILPIYLVTNYLYSKKNYPKIAVFLILSIVFTWAILLKMLPIVTMVNLALGLSLLFANKSTT